MLLIGSVTWLAVNYTSIYLCNYGKLNVMVDVCFILFLANTALGEIPSGCQVNFIDELTDRTYSFQSSQMVVSLHWTVGYCAVDMFLYIMIVSVGLLIRKCLKLVSRWRCPRLEEWVTPKAALYIVWYEHNELYVKL